MEAPASIYAASDGAAYETFLGRWTRRLAVPFLDFARLPAGAVLDVGCGTGSLAVTLAQRRPAARIVGIDAAAPYIAFARRQAGPNLQFEVADAAALPYPPANFAAAAAQLVVNFVPRPERAVAEMRRVVRPGGVVAATVWDFRGGLVYQRLFWDTAAGIDPQAGPTRDRLFAHPLALPDGLKELWQAGGLEQIERGSITCRMDYANFADYWEPLLGGQGPVGTYVAGLKPDLRATVKGRVRAAYLSGAPDGPRSLTATAWAVRGVVPAG